MLSYPIQNTGVIFGSKDLTTLVATAEALPATYGTLVHTFDTGGYSKMNLDVVYTQASGETGNSIKFKFEGTTDGVNYSQFSTDSTSGGTSTLAQREFTFDSTGPTVADGFQIPLDIFYKKVRVYAREEGVVTTAGTVYSEVTLSGK